jgi:hypothetical protein
MYVSSVCTLVLYYCVYPGSRVALPLRTSISGSATTIFKGMKESEPVSDFVRQGVPPGGIPHSHDGLFGQDDTVLSSIPKVEIEPLRECGPSGKGRGTTDVEVEGVGASLVQGLRHGGRGRRRKGTRPPLRGVHRVETFQPKDKRRALEIAIE